MPVSICPISVNTSDGDTLSEYSTLPSLAYNYADNMFHLTNLDMDLNMPVLTLATITFMIFTAIMIFLIVYQVKMHFLF